MKNITFGPHDTWWVSFQDDTAGWSENIPSYISEHLEQTTCLVLNPRDGHGYFIFKENGEFEWQVNDDFDDDMNDSEDDDICYIDPQTIRYTQTSISSMSLCFHSVC